MRCHGKQHGFTLFEVVVTVALAGLAVGGGMRVLESADDLSSDSRRHMRASARYREAHNAVGRVLQNIDIDTLSGFDGSGEATELVFQQVTGFEDGDVQYDTESTLKWVADLGPASAGAWGDVVLEPDGEPQEIVARHVLKDSFKVRQEGRNLVLHLSLRYAAPNAEPLVLTGETVVSLRN